MNYVLAIVAGIALAIAVEKWTMRGYSLGQKLLLVPLFVLLNYLTAPGTGMKIFIIPAAYLVALLILHAYQRRG